ncbi:juvenile hormone acid O-methyltransferase-like isoform X2 [Neodiprion pinetum]|uniref:juvenile hormone acid O-methyltransferase-like isoform X2 n=1 Tax=Neodiprion pinetum TaxID=441929 RepID=UPI003719AE1F
MMDVDRFVGVFQHAERPLETLKSLLRDVGFEVCHCSNRHTSYIYDTPDAHTGFMASIDPFMSRMPDELQREYLIDLGIEARRHSFIVNKDRNDDCSILSRRHTFVVYLKKPLVH